MPNLPTSLLLGLLALCWLVVLVPMFARSREVVPETDDGTAGFRVLRRAGKKQARTDFGRDDDEIDVLGTGKSMLDDRVQGRPEDDHFDGRDFEGRDFGGRDFKDSDLEQDDPAGQDDELVEVLVDQRDDWEEYDDDHEGDTDLQAHGDDGNGGRDSRSTGTPLAARAGRRVSAPGSRPMRTSEHVTERVTARIDRSAQRASRSHRGAPNPVQFEQSRTAHRPGRGGFDPEQAAQTAAYRYRRRRTVTLVLLFVGVISTIGAVLVSPTLWFGTGVVTLLVIGFLAYLSRQVKIERELRARRMAHLQRAQQIRPPARRGAAVSPYRGPQERPIEDEMSYGTQVPASPRRPGVVVDLDDDDPAFDDLEYYEPIVYRRAAGQ